MCRFRRAVERHNKEHNVDLLKGEFERISRKMGVLPAPDAEDDEIKTILVRMDSMMVEAHAKVMTRMEILYMTIVVALRYPPRNDLEYLILDALAHYLQKDNNNKVLYYREKNEEKESIPKSCIDVTVQVMVLLYDSLHLNFMLQFMPSVPELAAFERVYSEHVVQDENDAAFQGLGIILLQIASKIRLMKPSHAEISGVPLRERPKRSGST